MLLVAGLGNPGSGHSRNRHNIGFMAIDAIARRHAFARFRARFHGSAAEGTITGHKVVALKPLTFMNDSGRSLAAAAAFYRVPPADVIVLHDEIDLASGRLRVKTGGGHAGHNGLRSIQAHLGAGFRRVRLGVGHPGDKDRVAGHVLKNFAKADQAWLETIFEAIADSFGLLVEGDDAAFMSKVALAVNPPRPKPDKRPPAEPSPEKDSSDPSDGL
ncbi:MAG: aminoacyl-tRNA hydrolase [Rhodospirillales bacterium]|jgi:PTH1 family peptidyl-tRNA hydrolase|nr:aminoacyl-tRNA hydrolase [Rhodospirillales bacterium]